MADISGIKATEAIRLVGSETDGTEETPIGSTTYREILAYDVANNGGEDIELTLTPGQIVELKINVATRINRKYIQMQALDRDIKWGFSITTQNFNAYKAQFFSLPIGPNTSVFIKNNGSVNGKIAIAELS